ncbi:MAG: amino acid ABC transporter substrate-binding protein [Lachnospiraceae bacterium]|nr:amino acid ABC transporter substrate-binding protein [Lachnospiraceae bacterium]
MKKKLALVLILALSMTSILAGCKAKSTGDSTSKDATVKEDKDTSADRDTLIVGFDAEYPPYGYMDDNGEYVGFDLDCAQAVCDALGWKLEKKPINWDSKDMELNSGTIDCIWNGFSITPDRKDKYTWSSPYVDNTQVMVVSKDSGITKLDDLKGKNVVVQAASAALEALNGEDCADLKNSFGSLTENPDYNTAFMNLESGAADAVAIDIGVAQYQIEQREKGKFVIIEEPFYTEQYGIGFRLGDEALRDKVEEQLLKMVDSGEFEKLAVKYGIDPEMLCLGK